MLLGESPAALTRVRQISSARLESITELEREQQVAYIQMTWTARRTLRRLLEHTWEHLLELSKRMERSNDD